MTRTEFRFFDRLRVRWSEIDAQKIVFNGHYLTYFDTAVAAYWRALALPYAQAMELLDGDLFVRKATLDYLASARYDDVLDVGMRCERIGNSSILFQGAVFRRDKLLVGAELVYVFADPRLQTSKPVPAALRALLLGFEAGEPMLDVRLGDWATLGAAAQTLRTQVFVVEQKVPAELEWDEADARCVHAVAFNRLGQAVSTGRLLQHAPGVARIGRMASIEAMRGNGVGRAVLEVLMAEARRRGDTEVMLHAQRTAENFYTRAGFVARGEAFVEAGIAHIEMVKPL